MSLHRKTHKKTYRLTALLLAALIGISGCGNLSDSELIGDNRIDDPIQKEQEKSGKGDGLPVAEGSANVPIQENAKGRFLESDLPFEEGFGGIRCMQILEDGTLAVYCNAGDLMLSKDQGESFEKKELPALQELQKKDAWVSNLSIATDGSLWIEYYTSEEAGTEDTEPSSVPSYLYIDADGNGRTLSLSDAPSFFSQLLILTDGRLTAANNDTVYEIDLQTGSLTELCRTRSAICYYNQIGDCLYLATLGELEIYDLDRQSFEKDSVLADFLSEEEMENHSVDNHPILFLPSDTGDSLYVATSRGLFRHVLGGSVMEEVIKGSLSSLGVPNMGLTSMVSFSPDLFLICYNTQSLKKYCYDPDSPAVPEKMLTVYSLRKNDALLTAINLYRDENPDVYINYEVGMSGDDGITREDAIRSLNTALLSAKGPDVLILDSLPIRSYIQKGILQDLSPAIKEKCEDGTLLTNLATAFEKDGQICAIPSFVYMPVIVGAEGAGVTDLKSLADKVEALREQNPNGNIIGSYREKEVLLRFYNLCSSAIVKEDGSIDKAMLSEYLTQSKRIWDVEKTDLNPEVLAVREEQDEQMYAYFGDLYGDSISAYECKNFSDNDCLKFGLYENPLNDYANDISLMKAHGKEFQISILNGLSENVFVPATILGVNATSESRGLAEDFVLKMLCGKMPVQYMEGGITINQKALDEIWSKSAPGETLFSLGIGTPDGDYFGYDVLMPQEREREQFFAMLRALKNPAELDPTVKDVIIELGQKALSGEMSIEECVNEIGNRIQIYLAE